MKFKEFYIIEKFLEETPHVEYTKGNYIDFKSELDHKGWLTKILPNVFKKNKGKEKEISDNLTGNLGFVSIFKRDFLNLKPNLRRKLKGMLPKVFWQSLPTALLVGENDEEEKEKDKRGKFFDKNLDKMVARQALSVSSGMSGAV